MTLTLSGSFAARATDNGLPISTTATGDATGTNAAVGAALAVSFSDQSVTATTGSNITTPATAELRATDMEVGLRLPLSATVESPRTRAARSR